jgi:uncharacterized lipoprotein YmbA
MIRYIFNLFADDKKTLKIIFCEGMAFLEDSKGNRISNVFKASLTQEDDGYADFVLPGIIGSLDNRFVKEERSFEEALKSLEGGCGK